MKYFTLLIFIFFITGVIAQVPGYLGQRWAVYGEMALSPALNYKYLEYDDNGRSGVSRIGLNCRFEISSDFTFDKSQAVGISLKHISTSIPYAYYTTDLPVNVLDLEDASYMGDVALNANFVSFYIKFFPFKKRGSIAPVGHYNKIEIALGTAKAKTGKYSSSTYDPNEDYYALHEETLVVSDFEDMNYQRDAPLIGLMYSFGNQLVVFDKGIVDFNTQFGWILPAAPWAGALHAENTGSSQDEFDSQVAKRINGSFFLNITLGFGYLIL